MCFRTQAFFCTIHITLFILMGLVSGSHSQASLDLHTLKHIDSLFQLSKDIEEVHQLSKNPSLYYATAIATLHFPITVVASALTQYSNYEGMFKYVQKMTPLEHPEKYSNYYATYFELGNFLACIWALVSVDTCISTDSTFYLTVSQISDQIQTQNTRNLKRNSLFVMEVLNFHFFYRCKRIDSNQTRVCYTTWCSPAHTAIPSWFVTMATKQVVPKTLHDLNKYLSDTTKRYTKNPMHLTPNTKQGFPYGKTK